MRNQPVQNNRRGITLLFVVSMIVLFLLMGTAFVVVAGDFLRSSKKRARVDLHTIDGTANVERALYDILRGPTLDNANSPLRGQDILSDIYGYGFRGQVTATAPVVANIPGARSNGFAQSSQGQLIQLELVNSGLTNLRTGSTTDVLSDLPGAYSGSILTFVSGPAKGISARIIEYYVGDPGSTGSITDRKFVIAPDWSDSGPIALANLVNSQVIVNGRAFGGFGAGGFDNDATEGSAALGPTTLEPNRVGETQLYLTADVDLIPPPIPLPIPRRYLGKNASPNESYDGPDPQNMFLSGFDRNGDPIASFYRDSLANQNLVGGPTNRSSFAAFINSKTGTEYQVDNDNDGSKDSIWMDLGYPVQADQNGTYFKPLVAYHIVDLDGKINLNAAGNLADLASITAPYAGQGFGPAELSLGTFLSGTDYAGILHGVPDAAPSLARPGTPGRYGFGADGLIDNVVANRDEVPGSSIQDDWSRRKLFGYPIGLNVVGGFFASAPADPRGRFAIGTPAVPQFPDTNVPAFNNGLPVTDFSTFNPLTDSVANSPYESSFSRQPYVKWEPGDDDMPFSAHELERLLRPFDVDTSLLANRLAILAPGVLSDPIQRKSVTTESFEVPMAPFYAMNAAGRTRTLVSLLREKIKLEPAWASSQDFEIEPVVFSLLSPELFVGMKMDVNRPFGNGRDDNGNGVVDDPNESVVGETISELAVALDMDLDNDYQSFTNDNLAKHKYAKHLYVLTLLACEDSSTSFARTLDFRRAIAQWAINVVDFRDPDSINTPFEFDLNPWNGWNVDGVVTVGEANAGDRWLAWGCERPELLLTETFAHHDRALEDRADDDGGGDDIAGGDVDFDSRLVPRTSTFIELYNPWTQNTNNQILPAELADPAGTGIDIQRRSPGGDPVWRIGVKRNPAANAFLRSIYFTDIAANPPASVDPNAGEEFYTTLPDGDVPPLAPGRSAVVGSAGNVTSVAGEFKTTFGRRIGAIEGSVASLQIDDTRSITLVPDTNANTPQIFRNEWDGAAMVETSTIGIAVMIDGPRSLSLTDPNGGYVLAGATDVGDGLGLAVPLPLPNRPNDAPLDYNADPADLPAIWNNGITKGFRTIYLQRLANPLLDWNEDTNPYLTIDVSTVDLMAFNGVLNNPNNGTPTPNEGSTVVVTDGDTDFHSLERGESQTTNTRQLFARDAGGALAEGAVATGDLHNLSYQFIESFGQINDAYLNNGTDAFAWLSWNNRPFISQFELANVPFVASETLTAAFTLRDTALNPYTTINPAGGTDPVLSLGSTFGHLLNFYGYDNTARTPQRSNFYRLFDFTEVPSRYVGTETWLNANHFANVPFNFISQYRYPGKINLNTIPNDQVYNVLMGNYAASLNFTNFRNSLWNTANFRPFRNANEGNFVPSPAMVEENVDCGLYRRDVASGEPLFDFNSAAPNSNSDRSAYFRNAMRQRLANLTTTRSSVFAIWITVGYFEVNENGVLKGINRELGIDIGQVKRNRGFFIFDRSIPVAFEPGKNHNIDRAILVRSIIE